MSVMEKMKLNYFLQVLLVFWIISTLSFLTAQSMITGKVIYTSEPVQSIYMPSSENDLPPYKAADIGIVQFLVSFFFATLIMLIFMEIFKGKLLFEAFFSGAIIFGSQGPFGLFFGKIDAFLMSCGIVLLRFLYPRIWTQNIAIIFGISGISASLGMSIKPSVAATILTVLSAYDIIAVFKTRHMVKLFRGMAERGVMLALVVPKGFIEWRERFTAIKNTNAEHFIFLGTGDLALPVFFAVSSLYSGNIYFLAVILGASVGIFFDHLYFTRQQIKKPIPALPFIAAFSIFGYAAAYIVLKSI